MRKLILVGIGIIGVLFVVLYFYSVSYTIYEGYEAIAEKKVGETFFINSLINLTGQLEFSVKSDYPCKVREVTDNSVVTFIVAPRVEEE